MGSRGVTETTKIAEIDADISSFRSKGSGDAHTLSAMWLNRGYCNLRLHRYSRALKAGLLASSALLNPAQQSISVVHVLRIDC